MKVAILNGAAADIKCRALTTKKIQCKHPAIVDGYCRVHPDGKINFYRFKKRDNAKLWNEILRKTTRPSSFKDI